MSNFLFHPKLEGIFGSKKHTAPWEMLCLEVAPSKRKRARFKLNSMCSSISILLCCFFSFFLTKIKVLYLAWLSCRFFSKEKSSATFFPHISFGRLDLYCPVQPVLRWGTSFLCMSSRSLTFCRCGVFLNLTMCWNRRVSSMNGNQECLSSWHLRLSTVLPFYPGFFCWQISCFFSPFHRWKGHVESLSLFSFSNQKWHRSWLWNQNAGFTSQVIHQPLVLLMKFIDA